MQKNITSTLTTPRKPLKKLTQLNEKEQFHFLELFNNHTFKVTEKVDISGAWWDAENVDEMVEKNLVYQG